MTRKNADNITALYGNAGNLAEPERDVKPAPIVPKAPSTLSKRGRAIWKELTPELEKNALLTKRDKYTFAFLCEEAAVAEAALLSMRKEVNGKKTGEYELLDTDPDHNHRLRRSPSWIIYMGAKKSYLESAKQFGLSPTSRIGLLLSPTGQAAPTRGTDDPDEELFA